MFVSRTPGERFPPDESQGPELRKGLILFRVVNHTGLQIREAVELDSRPCGRIYPGEVFCVNRSAKTWGDRGRSIERLRVVQPILGWVSGLPNWVKRFQDGVRPGPIPLKSTLTQTCGMRMAQDTQGPETSSPRTKSLYSSDGVWPMEAEVIPRPQYFPQESTAAKSPDGIRFPKEKRFLGNTTRYLSKHHERQSLGLSSPGPARYVVPPVIIPSPPATSCPTTTRKAPGVPHRQREASVDSVGDKRGQRRRRDKNERNSASGPQYIGIAEIERADKHIGKAKAGSTGVPTMRLPIFPAGERENVDGFFTARTGAASPGPAQHFPNISSISPRGCPVFATPNGVDPAHLKKLKPGQTCCTQGVTRPKNSQVHRRWPAYTYYSAGRFSGSLGQDSPGPAAVNLACHDPFRPKSFLKTDVCCPPLISPSCAVGRRHRVKFSLFLHHS